MIGTRKVRAEVTRQMINDLSKMKGFDVIMEMERILVDSIQTKEKVRKLRKEKIEDLLN